MSSGIRSPSMHSDRESGILLLKKSDSLIVIAFRKCYTGGRSQNAWNWWSGLCCVICFL